MIKINLGTLFKVASDTRWNLFFNGLLCLSKFMKEQPANLATVMNTLNFFLSKRVEIEFVREYLIILRPVVDALNVLQSEKTRHVGTGYLLPTISLLKQKLDIMRKSYFFTARL